MCDLLFERFRVAYSKQQIHDRLIVQHGWTIKKTELRALEQNEELRAQYQYTMRSPRLGGAFSSEHIVFMDESHCKMKQWLRDHGTSPRGERIVIPSAFRVGNYAHSSLGALSVEGELIPFFIVSLI